ncbi:unnamed protein product [Symbiodinium microadriaticum]|nr:unnamed protein product [Symbiodinium sp. KB8]CAE7220723.1 unnamed protein product [Symbiodinium microadriaticum]
MRKEVKFNRVLVDGPGLTVSSKHVDHEFKNAHSADKWLFEIYSDHQELLVQGIPAITGRGRGCKEVVVRGSVEVGFKHESILLLL